MDKKLEVKAFIIDPKIMAMLKKDLRNGEVNLPENMNEIMVSEIEQGTNRGKVYYATVEKLYRKYI